MHLGAQGMRMLPKDILDTLAFRAEKNNLPPIGSPLNKGFWTSAQINIAPAVAFGSGGGALADALGQAGQSIDYINVTYITTKWGIWKYASFPRPYSSSSTR